MKSRKHAHSPPPVDAADDFDELRDIFNSRLQRERLHFVMLSAELARADSGVERIFEDLKSRAHRLHGGAAIFELTEMAAAAGALETAAGAAAEAHAANTDTTVWNALGGLVALIDRLQPRIQDS
jgi:HPt (histidine-containing phosphotransfer) domain-containing protein